MQRIYKILLTLVMVFLVKLIPFNLIVGSCGYTFSWSSILAPVLGTYVGFWHVLGFLVSTKIVTGSIFFYVLHRLPLFFATYAFNVRSIVTSIIVPIVCMVLFVIHPQGAQAWVYALYWFIPIACYFLNNTLFLRAITATFIAHAVGSIVWLYTTSIGYKVWLALIPVVAVERLLMAGCMMLCYYVFGFAYTYFKTFVSTKVCA